MLDQLELRHTVFALYMTLGQKRVSAPGYPQVLSSTLTPATQTTCGKAIKNTEKWIIAGDGSDDTHDARLEFCARPGSSWLPLCPAPQCNGCWLSLYSHACSSHRLWLPGTRDAADPTGTAYARSGSSMSGAGAQVSGNVFS